MNLRATVVVTKMYVPVSRRLWVEKRKNIQCVIIILKMNNIVHVVG